MRFRTPAESLNQNSRSKYLLLIATSLGFVAVQLDVTIVNVALQQIGGSFGSGISGLQWVVNAYTLVFAALILSAGSFSDGFGARRVFKAGFGIFTVASLVCGAASTLPLLIGARAIQGMGAAILVPCSLALLNHTFTEEQERAKAVGIWAAGAGVAVAAGPVVGGALIATIGWRSIFFINLPIGILGIYLVRRHARETTRLPDRGLDLTGQFLAIFALTVLAASMIEGGGTLGWAHPLTLAGLGIFGIALAVFILVESKTPLPMLPLSLFRDPTFAVTTVIGLFINVAFYGLIFVLSLFFQRTLHYTALQTGFAFLPTTGIVLGANLISGWIAARVGARIPILIGQIVMMTGCLSLLAVEEYTPYWRMAGQMLAIGAGAGLTVPAMTSALLGTVDKSQSGTAAGVLSAARQTGSVIGVALFGALIAQPGHLVRGLRISFIISGIILLFNSLLAFQIPRHRRNTEAP